MVREGQGLTSEVIIWVLLRGPVILTKMYQSTAPTLATPAELAYGVPNLKIPVPYTHAQYNTTQRYTHITHFLHYTN